MTSCHRKIDLTFQDPVQHDGMQSSELAVNLASLIRRMYLYFHDAFMWNGLWWCSPSIEIVFFKACIPTRSTSNKCEKSSAHGATIYFMFRPFRINSEVQHPVRSTLSFPHKKREIECGFLIFV